MIDREKVLEFIRDLRLLANEYEIAALGLPLTSASKFIYFAEAYIEIADKMEKWLLEE